MRITVSHDRARLQRLRRSTAMRRLRTATAALLLAAVAGPSAQTTPWSSLQTVFVIVLENHNWSEIKGNPSAPYINSLLPRFAHAERYFNPPGLHPSLPNYIWLEAGQNFGIFDDNPPSAHRLRTGSHLSTQLEAAGVTWKTYQEDISGTTCPLVSSGLYAVKHNPFVYFDDVTDGSNATSAHCIAHVRPYTQLESDLQQNQVARYNFITPNLCHDMHDCSVATGDAWLSTEVPKILGSAAYQHGVLLITFDESETGDGPIALMALSPFAKPGYSNSLSYTHSSTLRTLQDIFGVTPLLGDAANATDLSDLFAFPPRSPTNLRISN
jgi:phosphatidylinositol-3-phosphatase